MAGPEKNQRIKWKMMADKIVRIGRSFPNNPTSVRLNKNPSVTSNPQLRCLESLVIVLSLINLWRAIEL